MATRSDPPQKPKTGFEPWAFVPFAVLGVALVLYVFLGLRNGGRWPVLAYRYGTLSIGAAGALCLAGGLFWSALRRPVLQRKRIVPLLVSGGLLWLGSYPLPYPSSHTGRPSSVPFQLPFAGEWGVRFGGPERASNGLVLYPDRRFGFEFVPGPSEVERAARVLAPSSGRLVRIGEAVSSDEELLPMIESGAAFPLVFRVAPDEWLVLAGLKRDGLRVGLGDEVELGQPLGELDSRALLAFHLQDRFGEGIPLRFHGLRIDGRTVKAATPRGGQRVESTFPGALDQR